MARVLFFRDYHGFRGGHLKVWDYFNHVRSLRHDAYIRFTPASTWDASNPWLAIRDDVREPARLKPDLLFVSGHDWAAVDADGRLAGIPVINLIQHIRHADPDHQLSSYLSRPAVRICVSDAVAGALSATGRVNGPLHVIGAGVDWSLFPESRPLRGIDVLIIGTKQPGLARRLRDLLRERGVRVTLVADVSRAHLLELMADARVALCLPMTSEGFYLPGLEAMWLGSLPVLPNVPGLSWTYRADVNCVLTDSTEEGLLAGVVRALDMTVAEAAEFARAGRESARAHDIGAERAAFAPILRGLTQPASRPTVAGTIRSWLGRTPPKIEAPHAPTILLTGLPRSGTTLACELLNEIPDTVALDEPIQRADLWTGEPSREGMLAAVAQINRIVPGIRRGISERGEAPTKHIGGRVLGTKIARVDGERKKLTDLGMITVDKPLSPGFLLVVKHPGSFTALMNDLATHYRIVALIRNPVWVLASWQVVPIPVREGRMHVVEALDPELGPRLDALPGPLPRQLCLLDYFFDRYRRLAPSDIIRYEDLVADPAHALATITPRASKLQRSLRSHDETSSYGEDVIARIAEPLLAADGAWLDFYPRDVLRAALETP